MTLDTTLDIIRQRGIILKAQGSNLAYESPAGAMTSDLILAIKKHKGEIITLLTTEAGTASKGRPNWCLECPHGRYETDDAGLQVLWCGLADRAVLDMERCVQGYWVKDKNSCSTTIH